MIFCDALVIGGGLTARRCAEILSEKYNTLLICDGAGASPYIHGICIPLDTQDSVERFIGDTQNSAKHQCDKALVRTLCEGALALADEFDFDKKSDGSYDLLRPLGASVPRVASIHEHTGAYVMAQINENKKFKERRLRAVRLLHHERQVCGALCYDPEADAFVTVSARCVCLASGGFGGVFPFSTNSTDIGGDGIAMAYLAGCELRDMEFIQFEPTVALSPAPLVGKSVITTMLYEGATFRNGQGEQFLTSACVDKDVLSKAIYREILRGKPSPSGGVYYDATAVPKELLLSKYRSYYERYLRVGVDISEQMMEVAPAPHTTLGGVVIDTGCATALKGLFCMGEVTGGLHGANRLGGNAGLETLVFGKIGGESALAFLDGEEHAEQSIPSLDCENIPFSGEKIHTRVKEIAKNALGVIRNAEGMCAAMAELDTLCEVLLTMLEADGKLCYGAYRAYNDCLTVQLAVSAALARVGSVGAHERSDAQPEQERYTLYLSRDYGIKKEIIYE